MTSTIDHDEIDDLVPAETLAKLRADHPKAHYTVVEGGDGPVAVVFKRLTTEQFERAQGMANDERRKKQLGASVVRDILVYPTGKDWEELLGDCPAVRETIASLALEIAHGKAPEEAKKLRTSPRKPAAASTSTPEG